MSPLLAEDAVDAGGRRVRRRFGRGSSGALGLICSCLFFLGCRLFVLAVGFVAAEDFAALVPEAPRARWTCLVLLLGLEAAAFRSVVFLAVGSLFPFRLFPYEIRAT